MGSSAAAASCCGTRSESAGRQTARCGAISQVAGLAVRRPGLGAVVRCRHRGTVVMVVVQVRGIAGGGVHGLPGLGL
jgi:hypothetical protein